MAHLPVKLMVAVSLIAVAGCAKKKPADLPPPPAESVAPTTGNTGATDGGVGTGAVPGSRADFLAKAGTDSVFFATDSHDLDAEAQGTLRRHAEWLQQNGAVRVTIEGHCDERGTREYNLALGDRRANAAKNFLASNGVDPGRISVISYGKERPFDTGSNDAAWAQNRRAVTVVPNGAPTGGF
ncbi:peptidoglycan-associated lipoprotein Pal [Sphingomonas sp. 1P06PA]|uniref:peptidoglycan-associated lipoprotein Pal n=1 Tax=Sphingomonas sp. 1P06PA TaxID=554121 RepID=UPI0039A6B4FE